MRFLGLVVGNESAGIVAAFRGDLVTGLSNSADGGVLLHRGTPSTMLYGGGSRANRSSLLAARQRVRPSRLVCHVSNSCQLMGSEPSCERTKSCRSWPKAAVKSPSRIRPAPEPYQMALHPPTRHVRTTPKMTIPRFTFLSAACSALRLSASSRVNDRSVRQLRIHVSVWQVHFRKCG